MKIEAREKKLTDVTTSTIKWKEYKYTETTYSGEVNKRGEGNPWVEKRNKKNGARMAEGKKREQ